MISQYEAMIGLRYVRARRRNHFISFISMSSMIGVALGVAALITVISVMNGFEKELKDRILGMASHAVIEDFNGLNNWERVIREVKQHPDIDGAAPYLHAEGMLTKDNLVNGVIIRGVLPNEEINVAVVADKMVSGSLSNLEGGKFNIILGSELVRNLGIKIGDKVTLVAPQANLTPAGIMPRLKRFKLIGIFDVGMHEFDSGLALIHMEDSLKLFKKLNPTGIRLKTNNILKAPIISREIASNLSDSLSDNYWVIDWTQRHSNFFRALKTEKTVMFVILTLIVAVAAFNIISTLVMAVSDKQSDIAVLRTLGASPKSILQIFMIQGIIIGVIGIAIGVLGGVWMATNIETLVPALENILGFKFLSPDVYYISDLPSDMHWNDVFLVSAVSFVLCLLATIYPALRAAKVLPAEALRYE
ncbi:MAG: lipoprotein-releasing system transmembrane subunit LolC [Legionellales bacterium]|nr:lipoprotein-releasing system transmembrane subunit LolC [Legionellales bacterium]